ncbi:MAG: lipid biosynthesis B12-binding/radical SAM protein [Planctomycetota bacterium]
MKVLLISANTAEMPYPVYPIGMSMVAAAARDGGHEVSCFDFLRSGKSVDALRDTLSRLEPDVVGISMRNIDNVNILQEERYVDGVRKLVDGVRQASDATVVLGGSGFSIMPARMLEAVGGDYGVSGEGERAFVELLDRAERGDWPPEGTVLRDPEHIEGSRIPSPAYEADILAGYLDEGSVAPVQTKRGCPHNCVYCSYPALEGHTLRRREPARVVDDVEVLVGEHDVQYIFFTDSVFNDPSGSHMDVVREMNSRGIHVPWSAFFTPGTINPDNIGEMVESGLQAAELGSDAACDTTLKGQHKPFDWHDVVRANDIFQKADVSTAHYFMFGGPGENRRTVKEGIDNILALDCAASFVFLGIRILPDTELYEIALKQGVVEPNDDLVDPVYYFSPELERDWLEETLDEAFASLRHVVYPPGSMDDTLQLLHKLGHGGVLWDLLSKE